MMRDELLRILQREELKMAKCVIEICERHDIDYYIIGGTLLGAVRHKGFIPWDDDMDIGMKREDYERFILIAKNELDNPYTIHHYKNDEAFMYPYARIQNPNILLRRDNTKNKTIQELWVDIFPLDGVPTTKLKRFVWEKTLTVLRGLRNLACFDELVNMNKKYTGIKKVVFFLGNKTSIQKHLSRTHILMLIDSILKRYDFNDSELICNPMGGHWFREVFPKQFFSDSVKLTFEDISVKAPLSYKEVLVQMYGNYMQLPNVTDRNWHGITIIGMENNNE